MELTNKDKRTILNRAILYLIFGIKTGMCIAINEVCYKMCGNKYQNISDIFPEFTSLTYDNFCKNKNKQEGLYWDNINYNIFAIYRRVKFLLYIKRNL